MRKTSTEDQWVTAEARFPFTVEYIKPRARSITRGYFLGHDYVTIATAKLSDTSRSFKLIYRPKRGVELFTTVRNWRNQLWWRWPREHGDDCFETNVTSKKFLLMLRDSIEDPLGLGTALQEPFEQLIARKIISSDSDESLSRARRQAQSFLLCGQHVFKQGGEPVYVIEKSYSGRARRCSALIKIMDSSLLQPPVSLDGEGRPFPRNFCGGDGLLQAAVRGLIFRADQRPDAIAQASQIDPFFQARKCPEVVASHPVAANLTELRINAAFWLALRLERYTLSSQLESAINPAASFMDRAYFLKQYLNRSWGCHRPDLLEPLKEAVRLIDFSLAEVDDEALAALL